MLNNDLDTQFQTLICTVDTPAFLRRKQSVDAAWNAVLAKCRRQREEWLMMPRVRFRDWQQSGNGAQEYEQLERSVDLFNRHWERFLGELDLSEVNRLRQGYNDFYVLEKECAGASPEVARYGFEPLPMVTVDNLLELLPLIESNDAAWFVEE